MTSHSHPKQHLASLSRNATGSETPGRGVTRTKTGGNSSVGLYGKCSGNGGYCGCGSFSAKPGDNWYCTCGHHYNEHG